MARDLDAVRHRLFGSLCFWGEWFGKPRDNVHKMIECDAVGEVLRLRFDEGELLQVWNPTELSVRGHVFVIVDALRIRWEWFSYGRPQISTNLRFYEFQRIETGIVGDTNAEPMAGLFTADGTKPAVEMA
jgi:hypothetical protein